jgi:hypothetical protein
VHLRTERAAELPVIQRFATGFQVQLNSWTDCKLMRVTPVSIVLGLEVCPKTGIQFQVRIHFRQELNVLRACREARETSQK